MADTTTILLQKATTSDGTELDLSMCRDVALVETMDLSGPRLMLKFDDRFSMLRNILKLKNGDVLTCTLSDAAHTAELNWTAKFTIMSMPVQPGEIVMLNMLYKPLADIKTPAVKARLFPKENYAIMDVVKALFPGLDKYRTADNETFSLLNAYHVLPGDRPSMTLRQLAVEHGAMIYVTRGELWLRSVKNVYAQKADDAFQYNNPQAPHQVVAFEHINREKLVADKAIRKYSGFSITDGIVSATSYSSNSPEGTAFDSPALMNNLTKIPIPILDIVTWGAGYIAPGRVMDFKWNMDVSYNDTHLDESLPTHSVIHSVSHYAAGAQNYYCRVKVCVPYGQ